jgi:SAM-dependent methyltransferase
MSVREVWGDADAYERYMGRWSRPVAVAFLDWLAVPPGGRWLDVGCGTGALAGLVLERCEPSEVVGVDPAAGFVEFARAQIEGARFEIGGAQALPFYDGDFDAAVAGLVLNFVRDPAQGAAEMRRVARPGGTVAAYVWDYADKMEMLRYFWDAAREVDEHGSDVDEGSRFPLCNPEQLERLFRDAGMTDVEVQPIEVPTRFTEFDDYWTPFLDGRAPAPAYLASLEPDRRDELRELLRRRLPQNPDGSISLVARAWAVRGTA